MLRANRRCLYLNSPMMLEGIRTYLGALGTDVASETARGALILSSSHDHLLNGRFDGKRMVALLEQEVEATLAAGFDGLWATGDMTWEFGGERNFAALLDYECALEELFARQPALGGLCQYHSETLPREAIRDALYTHQAVYVNETLSRINPYYAGSTALNQPRRAVSEVDVKIMLEGVRCSAASGS
jgi:hypothetical protein